MARTDRSEREPQRSDGRPRPSTTTSRSARTPQWCAHLIDAARSASERSPEDPTEPRAHRRPRGGGRGTRATAASAGGRTTRSGSRRRSSTTAPGGSDLRERLDSGLERVVVPRGDSHRDSRERARVRDDVGSGERRRRRIRSGVDAARLRVARPHGGADRGDGAEEVRELLREEDRAVTAHRGAEDSDLVRRPAEPERDGRAGSARSRPFPSGRRRDAGSSSRGPPSTVTIAIGRSGAPST